VAHRLSPFSLLAAFSARVQVVYIP
jgi:hypothetical protein